MGKKKRQPSLIIKLFQPDAKVKRWISYLPPLESPEETKLKIEVQFMEKEKVWMAAGTPEDNLNYYYNQELSEIAPSRIVAITALLSRTELPMMVGLSEGFGSTLYDFYPDIEFHWQNRISGEFENEVILPNRSKLDLIFDQRNDGSWIWRNHMCRIEVMDIDSIWVATCDPRIRGSELVQRPKITVEDTNRDKAVNQLLKDENITLTFGLSYDQKIALSDLFKVIKILWRQKTQRLVAPRPISHQQTPSEYNYCSWATITRYCDGSFNCSFCGSDGEAYFMRWDD